LNCRIYDRNRSACQTRNSVCRWIGTTKQCVNR
jgi:hypothetical protein